MADEEKVIGPLTPDERTQVQKISANPMELIQGDMKSYMEEFVRLLIPSIPSSLFFAVGDTKIVGEDLTAETGVYVYEDSTGQWLYANGAAASQTTYSALYAFYGANRWGADAGGNFLLPDCRGRMIGFCGTHADTDLGDNDGTSLANRRPKHSHTNGLSVSGDFGSSTHTHSTPSHSHGVNITTGAASTEAAVAGGASTHSVPTHTHSVVGNTATEGSGTSGTPSATASPSLSGSIGSTGGTTDAPSYIFIGSLVVRFA